MYLPNEVIPIDTMVGLTIIETPNDKQSKVQIVWFSGLKQDVMLFEGLQHQKSMVLGQFLKKEFPAAIWPLHSHCPK